MRSFLLLTLLVVLLSLSFSGSSAQNLTFCQTYSGTTTNATVQAALIAAIVVRAAGAANYTNPANPSQNITIGGLFTPGSPTYPIFSGQVQYRPGAPDYTTNTTALGGLLTHLVGYFGALFGCTAPNFTAVNTYDMYGVHANMNITQTIESYFNTQLALSLLSLGVNSSDVNNVAAPALGLFGRCAPPIASLNSTALVQVCGDPSCALATYLPNSTACYQYYPFLYGNASSPFSSSSSSSAGPYVPPTVPTIYPTGSLYVPITASFNSSALSNLTQLAMQVQMDIAYNIAAENGLSTNMSTIMEIAQYIIIQAIGNNTLAPSHRRLLQNTIVTPIAFILLGNITSSGITGLTSTSTVSQNLRTAAASTSGLAAPYSGGTIPSQTVSPVTPGTILSSSSGSAYVSSSTGNGAASQYAVSGVLIALAAIVASLVL